MTCAISQQSIHTKKDNKILPVDQQFYLLPPKKNPYHVSFLTWLPLRVFGYIIHHIYWCLFLSSKKTMSHNLIQSRKIYFIQKNQYQLQNLIWTNSSFWLIQFKIQDTAQQWIHEWMVNELTVASGCAKGALSSLL